MVLFLTEENIIYAANKFMSIDEIKMFENAVWYDGEFSFSDGEEKEGYYKVFKWDSEKPRLEYVPITKPEPTQLDRMEEQLMKSQDEIRQEGADMVMEEMKKRGLIV